MTDIGDTKPTRPRSATKPIPIRPRLGTIKTATQHSGIGRSKLYEKAAVHAGLFKKFGGRTLVDFDVLDEILDALPGADIKAPHRRQQQRG